MPGAKGLAHKQFSHSYLHKAKSFSAVYDGMLPPARDRGLRGLPGAKAKSTIFRLGTNGALEFILP
jgi:hypothetical protein